MGGGIRNLFESTKRKNCEDPCAKKEGKIKEPKCNIKMKVCEVACEEKDPYSDPCEQEQDVEDKSRNCHPNPNTVTACCKPGCSVRMPCLACTKKGCSFMFPNTKPRRQQRDCPCDKPEPKNKMKMRSRSEVPSRNVCEAKPKPCCLIKPKKKDCNRETSFGRKSQRKADTCDDETSESEAASYCSTTDEPIVIECREPSKSPCRKLIGCPCDGCKNVKFKDKCEVIPNRICDDSCSEEDDTEQRSKAKLCPPQPKRKSRLAKKKPSNCEKKKCQCMICLSEGQAKPKSKSCVRPCEGQLCEPQDFCNMTLITPNFVMPQSSFGKASWPIEAPCPCGARNCSNTLSMNEQQSFQNSAFPTRF